jgi:hypothetical protein
VNYVEKYELYMIFVHSALRLVRGPYRATH